MSLRGYFWTGDVEYLKEMWPSAKAAISRCWLAGRSMKAWHVIDPGRIFFLPAAAEYTQRLTGSPVKTPSLPKDGTHAFNLYTIRVPKRDAVRQALTDAQIGTSQCYPQGLHLQDVYKHLGYQPGSLPVCEHACTETLSLPIYPGMPLDHIERVCEVLLGAARS